MKYSIIKGSRKNIERYVSFKIIEKVIHYNEGMIFQEYTRFLGNEWFVTFENGEIKLTTDENDASVFFKKDEPQVYYIKLIKKLKNKEIPGEGIQVIEYNELHGHSSEVLHYPNRYYPDLVQPISIYDGPSDEYYKACERRSEALYDDAYDELVNYINSNGWVLSEDEICFINHANTHRLIHLLNVNRGRREFCIPYKDFVLKYKRK